MANLRKRIASLRAKQIFSIILLLVSGLHFDLTIASDSDVLSETPENYRNTALIITGVQNCFASPSGKLPVPKGNEIIPVINRIRQDYSGWYRAIVVTQDQHCLDHVSFASTHSGYEPYSSIELTYVTDTGDLCSQTQSSGVKANSPHAINCTYDSSDSWTTLTQTLWPDHCIKGTPDSRLHPELITAPEDIIIRKGQHCQVDSYSAFFEKGEFTSTGLNEKLKALNVTAVHIVGLATDNNVFYTAKHAYELGYDTTVILDATRGVADNSTQAAINDMNKLGFNLINSTDLNEVFESSASTVTSYMQLVVLPTVAIALLNAMRS